MKITSLTMTAASAALLAAAFFATATVAQTPQAAPSQQPESGSPPEHVAPAPTNLQVLPKNLTMDQVHEIMEGWATALGTHCSTCHAADPSKIGPNGRPQLNFADDSRPEKSTARLMYKMVQDINGNYISMVDNSGVPVNCGTCHRGHLGPEPFVPSQAGQHPPQGVPPPAAPTPPSPK